MRRPELTPASFAFSGPCFPAAPLSWIVSQRSWGFAVEKISTIGCAACGTLAYSLQNIAPAEAGDGPNPEYPWPHAAPAHYPSGHTFALWNELTNTGQGRKLMEFVGHAVTGFENYA